MTTLAITAANIAGRAAVQTATSFALSAANRAISQAFDKRTFEGPRLESFHVQTSRDGAPMARVYGRIRLAGQVIWASHLREIQTEEPVQSGKGGGPTRVEYRYTISFAIGLCEGEILGVDRLWANGAPLETRGVTYRVYRGTDTQSPDPIISAIEGANIPAFRNTAYIVFEDFPLDDFGARLPQINAEVIRLPPSNDPQVSPKMETLIKSVNLLPGSGEFAYATLIVEETPEPGVSRPINMNNLSGQADILKALDQLEDQLPNCRHVSIISSWFGTSLDCATCEIFPAVEQAQRITPDLDWAVGDVTRDTAYLISRDSEDRPNYGGTPSDASIIQAIRELKSSRVGGQSTYPAVDEFVSLASDVKAIVGPNTSVTYAADWTEYFGHHPQDGSQDVSFHLDPLWASPNIDAVGIDAYFPLSDWREGDHLDKVLTSEVYNTAYLQSQIEGGEGYDYFYGSDAERQSQSRSVITDGAAGKPWVFRYKDLRNWWTNPHFNRVNGTEISTPTAWQAQSKPIHLLEIGCPAVRFGANQPNVFVDPKSSESQLPYFSDGTRDDFMQRRYLEALISYWDDTTKNPQSNAYNGRMIDTSRVSVWTWDARPYPDFPSRLSVWSDGVNWQTGHWIMGRIGLVSLADIIRDIATQNGLLDIDVTGLNGLVQGYHIDRPMSARAAISTLSELYGFSLAERDSGVAFFTLGQGTVQVLGQSDLVYADGGPIQHIYPDPAQALRDVRLHFINAATDYQLGLASAHDRAAETERILDISAPVVMDRGFADFLCDSLLARSEAQSESVRFSLSPSAMKYEVGDRVSLLETVGIWRLESIEGDSPREVIARRDVEGPVPVIGRPVPLTLNLPAPFNGQGVGVLLSPFLETEVEITGQRR